MKFSSRPLPGVTEQGRARLDCEPALVTITFPSCSHWPKGKIIDDPAGRKPAALRRGQSVRTAYGGANVVGHPIERHGNRRFVLAGLDRVYPYRHQCAPATAAADAQRSTGACAKLARPAVRPHPATDGTALGDFSTNAPRRKRHG